jgi:hypothetical protein
MNTKGSRSRCAIKKQNKCAAKKRQTRYEINCGRGSARSKSKKVE